MPDVVGQQFDVALAGLERAGIEDEPDVSGGGTFGVIDESNWTVCDQSPAAGTAVTGAPQLTVDRSCDDDVAETTAPTTETTVASTEPSTTAPEQPMTAATGPEFAAILSEGDYCSAAIEAFASTNGGRPIEFDGYIASLTNHGSYSTRFDIMLYAGDFSPDSALGPAFQFRDVNASDLNLTGPNIPDSLGHGMNLHVVANVRGYEESGCLFLLDPVSTSVR